MVKDAGHAWSLEIPIGLATLVIMRCLECLSHPRYSEDENALSNLRRYWKASVNLLAGTIQKIPSDDAWLDRDPSGEHANRQAGAADDGCEVLYGRAGFLYALLRVRKTLAEATTLQSYNELERSQREEVEVLVSDASLEVVVGSIMKRGKLGARSYARSVAIEQSGKHIPSLPPLMWSWHGRRYLGGAHGVTGSVYALLSASCVLDQDAANTPYFKKAIHLAHLVMQVDKFVQDGAMKATDRPWTMYEGMSGMCCAWAEVLQRLSKGSRTGSSMPGYDDLLTVE
ncbi:hypothetical protein FA15DRAFT_661268 [Coprinopsis marcescibilis]|uniref:Lanthionine synthetase C family protein n=1 Tax=Coprinopsis marcescibilis TaxID=230819 RepID=A0A5C3KCL8_COPMA|nr:hypothetical protein FA15DRAFT_661268 [Coprinopsis marcescibilis]